MRATAQKKTPVLYFVAGFAAAIILHGFYDFWLVSRGRIGELAIVPFMTSIGAVFLYSRALAGALNLSEFHPAERTIRISQKAYLAYGFASIILLQYLIFAVKFGTESANGNLLMTLMTSYAMLLIMVQTLGEFKTTKGEWIDLFEKTKKPEPATGKRNTYSDVRR